MTTPALSTTFVPDPSRMISVPAPDSIGNQCGDLPTVPLWGRGLLPTVPVIRDRQLDQTIPTFRKSSDDILDYTVDFTQWLASTGDTITAFTATVSAQGSTEYPLTLTSAGIYMSKCISMFLASGFPNTQSTVAVTATTSQGRTHRFTFAVDVTADGVPTAPPAAPTAPAEHTNPTDTGGTSTTGSGTVTSGTTTSGSGGTTPTTPTNG